MGVGKICVVFAWCLAGGVGVGGMWDVGVGVSRLLGWCSLSKPHKHVT